MEDAQSYTPRPTINYNPGPGRWLAVDDDSSWLNILEGKVQGEVVKTRNPIQFHSHRNSDLHYVRTDPLNADPDHPSHIDGFILDVNLESDTPYEGRYEHGLDLARHVLDSYGTLITELQGKGFCYVIPAIVIVTGMNISSLLNARVKDMDGHIEGPFRKSDISNDRLDLGRLLEKLKIARDTTIRLSYSRKQMDELNAKMKER